MITLKNVTLRRGTKVVLDSVSTTINPGENVGRGKDDTLFALVPGKVRYRTSGKKKSVCVLPVDADG